MQSTSSLHLYEEVLLLGLDSQSGKQHGEFLKYSIAGAVLAELLLAERIQIDSETLKVSVTDEHSLDDDLLDSKLQLIAGSKKPWELKRWIRTLPGYDICHESANRLCEHKILRREREKFLWVFSVTRFPLVDQGVKAEITKRIRDILSGVMDSPDSRSVQLLSLLFHSRIFDSSLGSEEFSKEELARLAELVGGETIGSTVCDVQEGVIAGRAKRVGMTAGRW